MRKIAVDDTDSIIRAFHFNLHSTEERPLLEGLTSEEEQKFRQMEQELNREPNKRKLDATADKESEVPAAKKTKVEAVS